MSGVFTGTRCAPACVCVQGGSGGGGLSFLVHALFHQPGTSKRRAHHHLTSVHGAPCAWLDEEQPRAHHHAPSTAAPNCDFAYIILSPVQLSG